MPLRLYVRGFNVIHLDDGGGGLRAKDYSIQEAGFQTLSVLAYAIPFKVILSGREPAYIIEEGGQKHEGARHITGNILILLRN